MSALSEANRHRARVRRDKIDERAIRYGASRYVRTARLPIPVAALICAMVIPFIFEFGGLRLTPNRLVLLVMALPCLVALLSGGAGRLRFPDIGLILLWGWSAVALAVNHGLFSQLEQIGIIFLESVGAYLIGRVYVRSADSFVAMVRLLFVTIILMLPIAIVEMTTSRLSRSTRHTIFPS